MFHTFTEKYPDVFQELKEKGIHVDGADFLRFTDLIVTHIDNRMKISNWLSDKTVRVSDEAYCYSLQQISRSYLREWCLKPFLQDLKQEFEDASRGYKKKLLLYGSHDVNVYYFLHSLSELTGGHSVSRMQFAATITLELYRNSVTNDFSVRVFFWNNGPESYPGLEIVPSQCPVIDFFDSINRSYV